MPFPSHDAESETIVLGYVVAEHATEAASLQTSRRRLLRASHVHLDDLQRLDLRIVAHLDGMVVAGHGAWPACKELLEDVDVDNFFVVVAQSLATKDFEHFDAVLRFAAEKPQLVPGLLAGLGWAGRASLHGVVSILLGSTEPTRRLAGVAACAMHRVDPGTEKFIDDGDGVVRARVLRSLGELGKHNFVSQCGRLSDEEDEQCRFWAAWSAVLLGDRERAIDHLEAYAFSALPQSARALRLLFCAVAPERGHAILQMSAADSATPSTRITGAGLIGDPRYAPWLINQMADDQLARLAGESFSLITGLDVSRPPFARARPENFQSGPSENPEDEDVEMDEDDDLPWPDQAQVQKWWNEHRARFTTGIRHFMGVPPTRAHCIDVLKNGYQRQRIAAAYHLCLLNPGTPLFEWRAPAWRQQRELAQMS